MIETLVKKRYVCERGHITDTGAVDCDAEATIETRLDGRELPAGWYWQHAPYGARLMGDRGRLSCPAHRAQDGLEPVDVAPDPTLEDWKALGRAFLAWATGTPEEVRS